MMVPFEAQNDTCRPNSQQCQLLTQLSGLNLASRENPQEIEIDVEKLKGMLVSGLNRDDRTVVAPPPFRGRLHDSTIPVEKHFMGNTYRFGETQEDEDLLFLLTICESLEHRRGHAPTLCVFIAQSPKEYRAFLERRE
jgi:hypothetical protein